MPEWGVQWMTLPPAGTACRAIIKSGCTKGCRGQCRCLKTFTAQCCANAVDVNYLGILGEDLGGRHHYNVIKLMFEVTLPILENI